MSGPLQFLDAAGVLQTLSTFADRFGYNMSRVQPESGQSATLDVTAATVIKSSAGRSFKVVVLVAGSAAGALYDAASTTGNTIANQLMVIPTTVGVYTIDAPHANGIVLAPGTGQTLAIIYS